MVATVTFDRPEVLNALTFEVYAQFRDLLEALRYDDDVKVLVLTGAGEAFCSGGDVHTIIGELLQRDVKGTRFCVDDGRGSWGICGCWISRSSRRSMGWRRARGR
ncbi:MAG: enoyl-CoA hydratase-related protein [Thermomicrobiales bacterium]